MTDTTCYDVEKKYLDSFKEQGLLDLFRISHVLKKVKPVYECGKPRQAKILDIGCGFGIYGYSLYTNRSGCKYTGIDVVEERIVEAKGRWNWGNFNPEFKVFDLSYRILPFASFQFDYVLLIQVIEHMDQGLAEDILREIKRVLTPKGTVVLMTENTKFTGTTIKVLLKDVYSGISESRSKEYHEHEYTYNELLELVNKVGFYVKNSFGLVYGYECKASEEPLKLFLSNSTYKMLRGVSDPEESKYLIFDLVKKRNF